MSNNIYKVNSLNNLMKKHPYDLIICMQIIKFHLNNLRQKEKRKKELKIKILNKTFLIKQNLLHASPLKCQ